MIVISTHTPLAGRDREGQPGIQPAPEFLLTRPLRDVTPAIFPQTGKP